MKREPRYTVADQRILTYLFRWPDSTSVEMAKRLKVRDHIYGEVIYVSRRLPRLRKLGLVADVKKRCRYCGCALTRGKKNVELRLTKKGSKLVMDRWA